MAVAKSAQADLTAGREHACKHGEGLAPDRACRAQISRFDGTPGQTVVLQGRWELIAQRGGKQESLGVREAIVTEKIDGPGYDALVAAMQRALVRFGQQVADTVVATTAMAKAR